MRKPALWHPEIAPIGPTYASHVPFRASALRIPRKDWPARFHLLCIASAISDKFSLITDIT
ncbi:hypothetical protein AB4Y36_16320 [Paraburkholderia sp. BR10936]|uniref:Uncharacterized protein n=1 Tax=Paraburkholderia ferrariae TaxID=386056 RepID=A0ABU9RR65_9BURK